MLKLKILLISLCPLDEPVPKIISVLWNHRTSRCLMWDSLDILGTLSRHRYKEYEIDPIINCFIVVY